METTEMTTEILNDLVEINNDRIIGYEKAIKELGEDDQDLKEVFLSMIDQSHDYRMSLAAEVAANGMDIDTSTTERGKIYRGWMELKTIFTGHDRKAILSSCEFGEDAAQRAYRSALDEDDLPRYIRTIIYDQQNGLKASHDRIRAYRDSE